MSEEEPVQDSGWGKTFGLVLLACIAAQAVDTFLSPVPWVGWSLKGLVFYLLTFLGSALVIFGGAYLIVAIIAWIVWRGVMRRPRESLQPVLIWCLLPVSLIWAFLIFVG
jgi:hypothetical protein